MCGIAGLVAADQLHADEPGRAERMRDVLAHRGPDEAGLHVDQHAALAHRRLSIVDLSGGHQPLSNENGTIWVTYNGEIYNHTDVRRDLEAVGHRYRTRSDTETIVHAYEEWGDACPHRFRGMFAFAIWDAPRRRLLLVRDRLGIKPLYWTLSRGDATRGPRLLFASEIKSLLESGLVPARARTALLPEVLATRYTSGADTLFEGIYKLLPGHHLVYENGRVDIRQYWDVPHEGADPEVSRRPDAAVLEQFRALLEESVRLRLMADVPLGAFLSGGIDSSVITALMARATTRPVQTFSVAFEDRAFSELEYAREVAQAVGAEAHEIVISDRDFFGALPRLVWFEDEPIAHPSSVPLHFVSILAREHVKVVLTGEGADELLAGYGKYPRALFNWHAGGFYERVVPAAARRLLASSVVPRLPALLERYASRSFLSMPRDPAAMFLDSFAGIPIRAQRALLKPSLLDGSQPYAASLAYFDSAAAAPLLDRMLYTDMKTYLVELLMKQDQMSMSASIESRVPFLDHVLVEFAARLPQRFKLKGLTTKRILRDAAAGLVPPSILTRRKMGFPVPFNGWAAGTWNGVVRDVLLDRSSRQRGLVDPVALERLLADHQAGRRRGGDALWALLNLELWYRTFIDREGVQTLPAPSTSSTGAPATAWQPASAPAKAGQYGAT
jgi:asparagine synthase (glutamine-hydrolysing)